MTTIRTVLMRRLQRTYYRMSINITNSITYRIYPQNHGRTFFPHFPRQNIVESIMTNIDDLVSSVAPRMDGDTTMDDQYDDDDDDDD